MSGQLRLGTQGFRWIYFWSRLVQFCLLQCITWRIHLRTSRNSICSHYSMHPLDNQPCKYYQYIRFWSPCKSYIHSQCSCTMFAQSQGSSNSSLFYISRPPSNIFLLLRDCLFRNRRTFCLCFLFQQRSRSKQSIHNSDMDQSRLLHGCSSTWQSKLQQEERMKVMTKTFQINWL